MAERRRLVEGLETVGVGDRTLEAQFVYGKKAGQVAAPVISPTETTGPATEMKTQNEPAAESAVRPEAPRPAPLIGPGRVPVGARIRTELASALKRASLERQLHGLEPNTVQDILEEALEPWLRRHGYLK
jgi:hypothetical protein